MSTYLSRYFRSRREANRLTFGDLARRCGYKNISKGANRIQRFEERGEIEPDLLAKLTDILGITLSEVQQCEAEDRADWERWGEELIEPHLVVRLIPGFYCRTSIPLALQSDRHGMETFAFDFAKSNRMSVCLVLSRRLRVWFARTGTMTGTTDDTFERAYGPYMSIGGHTFLAKSVESAVERKARNNGPNT